MTLDSETKPWAATALTLFPEAFPGVLAASVIGGAEKSQIWSLETVDIRDFSSNKHRTVDGTPAGGGAGMVLRPDIAAAAIDSVPQNGRALIYLTPRGTPLTQERVKDLAAGPGVIVFCARFEGLDERVIAARQMEEISIGDYVLAGGEVAAQVLIEACVRLIPGVLGKVESTVEESFEEGLLEYPLYTKPREFEGRAIPDVLLSGNHKKVDEWRKAKMIEATQARRPDLFKAYSARQERKTGDAT